MRGESRFKCSSLQKRLLTPNGRCKYNFVCTTDVRAVDFREFKFQDARE
jgi:hypothetical protein